MREFKSSSHQWLEVSYTEWLNFADQSLDYGFHSIARKVFPEAVYAYNIFCSSACSFGYLFVKFVLIEKCVALSFPWPNDCILQWLVLPNYNWKTMCRDFRVKDSKGFLMKFIFASHSDYSVIHLIDVKVLYSDILLSAFRCAFFHFKPIKF